ncbi:MAG: nucleotide exchange factor GrpE [Pseudomonadota bacterium]|jgi:molecular chaperone GrpE|nr:nucleotide exchange factor GrpE [Pseudomonadales bacterium]MEC7250654.1 nucleotide exchange factor GrpE [Pseudomonadota bacterium]MEC7970031.1 nucleotide exchange factor GrpE [Pseudomonadota bacterium]MEC7975473.1 nucleotide exchange factor GrpE [Pseudomonadota bacterium]MEC7990744.1 nucleotide exchange factor GrpE [Pseudomonadota bacterium]|tara:strand:+ start:495 stop:1049 length:555 start_codon:yes stop_codon:yes gene_type:complete
MGDNDTSETQQSAPEPELDQEQAEVVDQQTEPVDPEAVEAELAKVKDQLLRTIAESENIRRRASRDVENAHKFAVEKLLNDLFPVLDSLEKAVETATQTTGAEAIAEGVELSLKMFVSTLEKSGVAQIDPLGEPFDPQHHEAMAMVPNPDAEPNSVMEVMQKGYLLNERLVRAAKVIVVKAADQ